MTAVSLWICGRCSTVLHSVERPKECDEDQGGCKRPSEDAAFLGPFPEGAKAALEIDALYRKLRLEDGLTEPQAREVLEREREEPPEIIRDVLRQSCLLDEWPVGWEEEEWPELAKWMTFADVEYWLGRLIDTSETNLLILPLLAAQGHLSSLLKEIGPSVHVIPVSGRFSAGKSRCGMYVTYLGGGKWLASATVPALKSARKHAPILLGIDEGDEAEKDNPGVKAYLLASHDWGAVYLKFSEPGEKGKRELVEIPYGGPIVITFRKKPWEALASRAHIVYMEPSKRASVSDDGVGFAKLLGPAAIWLRSNCEESLRDKNGLWAQRRVHEPDFVERLNRVTAKATILRQRDVARVLLLIAELLALDMKIIEERLTKTIEDQELESENATIVEAIESDPLFQLEEVGVEDLRLSVQKFLRDRKEFVDLTRNRFADVLKEMGFSKEAGPTWKRIERDGREFMAIFPTQWRKGRPKGSAGSAGSAGFSIWSNPHTRGTPHTTPLTFSEGANPPLVQNEIATSLRDVIRSLTNDGATAEHAAIIRAAQDRGIQPDDVDRWLKRWLQEGEVFSPQPGTYRLTEGLT